MMPPKLVKLAANYLAEPLTQSINNNNAKVTSVTPIDKKT